MGRARDLIGKRMSRLRPPPGKLERICVDCNWTLMARTLGGRPNAPYGRPTIPHSSFRIHHYIPGPGVIDPNTTRLLAPVTDGTFPGSPSSVAAPNSANATASFAD